MKENGKFNFDIKFVIITWGCILILENNEREKPRSSPPKNLNFMILGISSQRVGGVI